MSYQKNKGRSEYPRYVKLEYYLLNSNAYQSLSFGARATYIEFKKRYNGRNNGEIGFAVRDMAKQLGCAPNSASKYIQELLDRGFIRYREKGAYNCKYRMASEFILTEYEYANQKPTKDYMKWKPEN